VKRHSPSYRGSRRGSGASGSFDLVFDSERVYRLCRLQCVARRMIRPHRSHVVTPLPSMSGIVGGDRLPLIAGTRRTPRTFPVTTTPFPMMRPSQVPRPICRIRSLAPSASRRRSRRLHATRSLHRFRSHPRRPGCRDRPTRQCHRGYRFHNWSPTGQCSRTGSRRRFSSRGIGEDIRAGDHAAADAGCPRTPFTTLSAISSATLSPQISPAFQSFLH